MHSRSLETKQHCLCLWACAAVGFPIKTMSRGGQHRSSGERRICRDSETRGAAGGMGHDRKTVGNHFVWANDWLCFCFWHVLKVAWRAHLAMVVWCCLRVWFVAVLLPFFFWKVIIRKEIQYHGTGTEIVISNAVLMGEDVSQNLFQFWFIWSRMLLCPKHVHTQFMSNVDNSSNMTHTVFPAHWQHPKTWATNTPFLSGTCVRCPGWANCSSDRRWLWAHPAPATTSGWSISSNTHSTGPCPNGTCGGATGNTQPGCAGTGWPNCNWNSSTHGASRRDWALEAVEPAGPNSTAPPWTSPPSHWRRWHHCRQ